MRNIIVSRRATFVVCVGVILLFCSVFYVQAAFAEETFDELNKKVDDALDNLDFSEVEKVSDSFFDDFAEKVRQIIDGEFDDTQSVFRLLVQLVAQDITEVFPQLLSVFCVLVICGLVRNASDGLVTETTQVVSFVGISVVVVSVLSLVVRVYNQVDELISNISALSDAAMPVLLTLLVANGGVSSSVCQPAMVVFSSVVISVVKNVVLPLSVFGLAFVVVGNLSENVKVTKTSEFLNGCSSWVLGVTFMVFSSFTAIQGIAASSVDGVTYRAAKFAVKNYVPVLGGYVSDGFDVVVASTSLVKNAFGVVSMLVVFYMTVKPLVTLVCVKLGLQAVAAVSEPLADARYLRILNGFEKSLTFLSALVVAVAFMFCILALVAISCANFA